MEQLNLTGRSKHDTPDELATLSTVLIDGDDILVDNGAIHGKSRFERGVDFRTYTSAEQVPNARRIPVIWITLKGYESGRGYGGICVAEIFVNTEDKVGFKSMPLLVNQMDGAMKGKVDVSRLSEDQKKLLVSFLEEMRGDLWTNTPDDVKAQLA